MCVPKAARFRQAAFHLVHLGNCTLSPVLLLIFLPVLLPVLLPIMLLSRLLPMSKYTKRTVVLSIAIACTFFAVQTGFADAKNNVRDKVSEKTLKTIVRILKESPRKYQFKQAEKIAAPKKDPNELLPVYEKTTETQVASIRKLLADNNSEKARSSLQSLLSTHSNDYYLLYLLAESHRQNKEQEEALKYYTRSFIANRHFLPTRKGLRASGVEIRHREITVGSTTWLSAPDHIVIEILEKERQKKPVSYSWMGYAMARSIYRFEGYYRQVYPKALWYKPSYDELLFAYRVLLLTWSRARQKNNTSDRDLDYLLGLQEQGLLPGYIFVHVYTDTLNHYNRHIIAEHGRAISNYISTRLFKNQP